MTVVSNPNEYSVEGLVDTGSGNQRVIMTQSVEGTQQDYSETSVECIVEDSSGNKQRCVCVNNFGGGGGSGGVTSVNGQTGAVTLGADDVLPSQTGNSGKFITTDGTNASWGSINALQNKTTADNSIVIEGNETTVPRAVTIGYSAASGTDSVCVGYSSSTGNMNTVSVGSNSYTGSTYGTAIGANAMVMYNCANGIAIGYNAKLANGSVQSIQLGTGTANTNHIFSVGFSGYSNYTMLDGTTGLIPAARHATLPASDGTYTLKLTISDGTPTLSWVAD